MAPMEFAVVRNNVYKLAVTNISRLGHPRISDNDPDNPGPPAPRSGRPWANTLRCGRHACVAGPKRKTQAAEPQSKVEMFS